MLCQRCELRADNLAGRGRNERRRRRRRTIPALRGERRHAASSAQTSEDEGRCHQTDRGATKVPGQHSTPVLVGNITREPLDLQGARSDERDRQGDPMLGDGQRAGAVVDKSIMRARRDE